MDAFIVESEDHYAHRQEAIVIEKGRLKPPILKREQYLKMAFFQYMIGNCDWSVSFKHNIEIIRLPNSEYHAIPYDFDYSGLVNASYATPHPMLPIDNVRDRLFQWKGKVDEDFSYNVDLMQDQIRKYKNMVEATDILTDASKSEMNEYLEEFTSIIEDPEGIQDLILKTRGK